MPTKPKNRGDRKPESAEEAARRRTRARADPSGYGPKPTRAKRAPAKAKPAKNPSLAATRQAAARRAAAARKKK